jgi:hypothetical protein
MPREPEQGVPLEELVDLEALRRGGREPTRSELRAALPRGWVLCEDGRSARRDVRLLFREGWILLVGLVVFGLAGAALFVYSFPAGWAGVLRFLVLVGVLLVVGGLVAPIVTRALRQRS